MKPLVTTLATSRPAIELDGIHGSFSILNCSFQIQFFSTFASPSSEGNEDHYKALLKELKPMRERVAAKDISDLNALLQRDLNDDRIARELVPYLAGLVSRVGFFPPVLAVLVPKGFIHQPTRSNKYPTCKSSGETAEYGNFWKLQFHPQSKRLARLWIYDSTEIIVLDGQHRSNAFRFVTGAMEPDELHEVFYSDVPEVKGFRADLPVTIAWFTPRSSKTEVRPNDISRELFVAVNNNAKPVSTSRTILLDDKDPVSLAVNTYYSVLAERRGFRPGGMNLLTSGFDVEISESQAAMLPALTISNPVILAHATTYAFFGTNEYDALKRSKATKHAQTNKDRFERLFGTLAYIKTIPGEGIEPLLGLSERRSFREAVRNSYVPLLDALFDGSALAKVHHEAILELDRSIANGSSFQKAAWSRIYCGGEGLYAQILKNTSKQGEGYRTAIREIEKLFKEIRAKKVAAKCKLVTKEKPSTVDAIYERFGTVACQTGVLMAISASMAAMFEDGVKDEKARHAASKKIKDLSLEQWVAFLHVFREAYLADLESNSWPRFQKLFIRMFYPEIPTFVQNPGQSPDAEMIVQKSIRALRGLALEGKLIDVKKATEVLESSTKSIAELFKAAGVKMIKPALLTEHIEREIGKEVSKLNEELRSGRGASRQVQPDEQAEDANGLI